MVYRIGKHSILMKKWKYWQKKQKVLYWNPSVRIYEPYKNYKILRNKVNNRTQKIKETYWQVYTPGLEEDLYGD